MDRRTFMRTAATGCSLSTWWALSACASVPTLHPTVEAGRVRVARVDVQAAFGAGSALLLQSDTLPESIYVLRDDNDTYTAVGATCTHLGCQVRPANNFLRCPCHGSSFNFDGGVVRGPATQPLPRYRLDLVGEHIVIELP